MRVWKTNLISRYLLKKIDSRYQAREEDIGSESPKGCIAPVSFKYLNKTIDCLEVDGWCPKHEDSWACDEWSLLFVLRNKAKSYVWQDGVEPIVDQPTGTAILFNTWKYHGLSQNRVGDPISSYWLAAVWDFAKKPSVEACNHILETTFKGKRHEKDRLVLQSNC